MREVIVEMYLLLQSNFRDRGATLRLGGGGRGSLVTLYWWGLKTLFLLYTNGVGYSASCELRVARLRNNFRTSSSDPAPTYNIVVCHKEVRQWSSGG